MNFDEKNGEFYTTTWEDNQRVSDLWEQGLIECVWCGDVKDAQHLTEFKEDYHCVACLREKRRDKEFAGLKVKSTK